MADGPNGLPRTDSLAEAGPSTRLSDDEDHHIAAEIQDCFSGCAVQLQPCIQVFCRAVPGGFDCSKFETIADRAVRRVALNGNGIVGDRNISAFEAALRAEIEADGLTQEAKARISDGHLRQFSTDGGAIANDAVKAAQELANRLVLKFQRLAFLIARQLNTTRSIAIEDLKQEALIGLRHAALTFEHRDGSGFAAYARKVVRNHVVSCIRRSVAPTEYFARQIEEFKKAEADLQLQGHLHPSRDDVFDRLGWSQTRRAKFRQVCALPKAGGTGVDLDAIPRPDSDEPISANELAALQRMISELPPEDQLIWASRRAGESVRTIAKRLHLPEHQVRSRFNALKHRMATEMQQGNQSA